MVQLVDLSTLRFVLIPELLSQPYKGVNYGDVF